MIKSVQRRCIYNHKSPWSPFKVHQHLLISQSPTCSIAFVVLWQGPSICKSFHFLLFTLSGKLDRQHPLKDEFFFICKSKSRFGLQAVNGWSVCISKSQRILCESFSRIYSGFYLYQLLIWSNCFLWKNSAGDSFLRQSCLVEHSFGAKLLYSLSIWLSVSSRSTHYLGLYFRCVLSIFALI